MPVVSTRVQDFYAILGITKNATEEDIKAAFKALALQWHPDRHPQGKKDAARKFIEINEAYRFLMDKRRRAWYDNLGPATGTETRRGRASTTEGGSHAKTPPTRAKSEADMMEKKTRAPAGQDANKTRFFSESTPKAEQQVEAATDPDAKPLDGADVPLPGSRPIYARNMTESWAQFVAKASTFIPSSNAKKTQSDSPLSEPKSSSLKDELGELSTGSTSPSNVLRSSFASPRTFFSSSDMSGPKSISENNMRKTFTGIEKKYKAESALTSRNAIIDDDGDDDSLLKKLGVRLETITDATGGAPSEWVFPLPLTLEELHEGTLHRYRITRSLLSGERKNIMVDIEVVPGWKEGTKIRFPGAGNERRNNKPQDIVFVVQEISHSRYKREGSNLIANIQVPVEDASVGNLFISLPGLDGKKVEITTPPGVINPGDQFIIRDAGMPIRRQGKFIGKGDMIIRVTG